MGFRSRCGKNGSTAPPINIQRSAPRATFHVHVRKSVHSCNITIPTKKSPGTKSETQQEVGYFDFLVIFSDIFAICRCYTLTNSSQRFNQMNTKIGHCNLKPFVTLNCEDLEFSSEGVSVASSSNFDCSPWNRKLLYSGMLCPICTKLHMLDKTPDLKSSTVTIFSYSNSATCWQQEVTCLLCN